MMGKKKDQPQQVEFIDAGKIKKGTIFGQKHRKKGSSLIDPLFYWIREEGTDTVHEIEATSVEFVK